MSGLSSWVVTAPANDCIVVYDDSGAPQYKYIELLVTGDLGFILSELTLNKICRCWGWWWTWLGPATGTHQSYHYTLVILRGCTRSSCQL